MKITKAVLKRIITEEIGRFVREQAETGDSPGGESEVELNPDAKRDTQQTATNIKNSNAQTLAQLQQFKEQNPNLDMSKIDSAISQLQQIGTEVDASLQVAISESEDDITEIIRKLSSGDYRVYSKKKNPKTGERRNLGTYSSKKGAEDREKDINFFKTLK